MAKADGFKIKMPDNEPRQPRYGVWLLFSLALVCALLAAFAWLSASDVPAGGEPEGSSGRFTIVTGTRYTLPSRPTVTTTKKPIAPTTEKTTTLLTTEKTTVTTTKKATTTANVTTTKKATVATTTLLTTKKTTLTTTKKTTTTAKITTTKKTTVTTTTANPRKDILICIDAGHGGYFSGATAKYNGETVYEKEITLDLALRAAEHLRYMGYSVLLTRDEDESIIDTKDNIDDVVARVEKAKAADADMLISIHCNAFTSSSAYGPIVFYRNTDNSYDAAAYAEIMSQCITAETKSLGVRTARTSVGNDYAVLKGAGLPSLLFETGFLTNPTELSLMMSEKWREAMSLAIANSVESAYLSKILK